MLVVASFIDNIAALPTGWAVVVSTVRVSRKWARRQESRRAGQAAAGERCNRRDL